VQLLTVKSYYLLAYCDGFLSSNCPSYVFETFTLEFKGLKEYFIHGLYERDHSNADVKETIRTLANGTYIDHFHSIFGLNTLHCNIKWTYIIKYN
jgi:hypothetical protein